MTIGEWWAEFDAKMAESERIEEIASGTQKSGGFSSREWAEARRKHKEKMANK
mgnify:FL=1